MEDKPMKIKEIWFDTEHIYGRDEKGHEYSQSILWYPKLRTATDEERAAYTFVSHTKIQNRHHCSASSLPTRKST